MTRFIVMRLLTIVPIMFGVSFFVFILAHLAPGDVTTTLTGPYATEETREQIRESLGLNEPLPDAVRQVAQPHPPGRVRQVHRQPALWSPS